MTEWVSVKNTEENYLFDVLCVNEQGDQLLGDLDLEINQCECEERVILEEVTHWRHLPEPPTKENKKCLD